MPMPYIRAGWAQMVVEPFVLLGPQLVEAAPGTPSTFVVSGVSWSEGDGLVLAGGWAQGSGNARTVSAVAVLDADDAVLDPQPVSFTQQVMVNSATDANHVGVYVGTVGVAGAAGSNRKLRITLNGSGFAPIASVAVVPGGLSVRQKASGVRNNSGSEIVLTLADLPGTDDSAILPTSLLISHAHNRNTASTLTAPADYGELFSRTEGAASSSVHYGAQRAPNSSGGNGTKTATWSDIGNPSAASLLELTRPGGGS